MQFIPTGERVLIELTEVENKTAGGLIIPDSNKSKSSQGKIISISHDIKDGTFKVGDVAVFTKSYDLKVESKEYVVVNKEDILGIFNK